MTPRPAILQPLLAAGILALGFGTVWAVVVFWCTACLDQFAQASRLYWGVSVMGDGTPLIVSRSYGDYMDVTYGTLDGEVVRVGRRPRWLNGTSLTGPDGPLPWPGYLPWPQRIRAFADDASRPPVLWYLVHDGQPRGTAYFVGYDAKSRRRVGFLGLAGFRPDELPQEDLIPMAAAEMRAHGVASGNSWHWEEHVGLADVAARVTTGRVSGWIVRLISEDRLLEFDLHRGTVRTILGGKEILAIGALDPAFSGEEKESRRDTMALRTPDAVLVIDAEGRQLRSYTIPDALRGERFELYELGEGRALAHVLPPYRRGSARAESLIWFNEPGEVERRHEIPPSDPSFWERPRLVVAVTSLAIPAPAVATPVNVVVDCLDNFSTGEFPSYRAALAQTFRDHWPPLLALDLFGLALAWLCHRHQAKHARPWTWVWVAFVFLFGLPGLVGYLCHRVWPVRKPCQTCFACGEPFPGPEPRGTELLVTSA